MQTPWFVSDIQVAAPRTMGTFKLSSWNIHLCDWTNLFKVCQEPNVHVWNPRGHLWAEFQPFSQYVSQRFGFLRWSEESIHPKSPSWVQLKLGQSESICWGFIPPILLKLYHNKHVFPTVSKPHELIWTSCIKF